MTSMVSQNNAGFKFPPHLSPVVNLTYGMMQEKAGGPAALLESVQQKQNNSRTTVPDNWDSKDIGHLTLTKIEECDLYCFDLGGEKRVNLPQLLRLVLNEFDVETISAIFNDHHLHVYTCNHGQLNQLYASGVLPRNVDRCGLIRKSDAERICKVLLHQNADIKDNVAQSEKTGDFFSVEHHCFGKQTGRLYPDMYTTKNAKCIECIDCMAVFCPQVFVGHTHKTEETRGVCHWGFDSANWRRYLRIPSQMEADQTPSEIEESHNSLENIKKKFTGEEESVDTGLMQAPPNRDWNRKDFVKLLPPPPKQFNNSDYGPVPPPNFLKGSPVLVNPECVIPRGEANNYDRDFAPNVCLAPSKVLPPTSEFIGARTGSAFAPISNPGAIKSGGAPASNFLENAGTQMMRQILHGNLHVDTERTKLFAQFVDIQHAYRAQIDGLTRENKRIQYMISEERSEQRGTIDRLEHARKSLQENKEMNERQSREEIHGLISERDQLRRQIKEAGCPDAHKTRMKYNAVKDEVERVTSERNDWRKRCLSLKGKMDDLHENKKSYSSDGPVVDDDDESTMSASDAAPVGKRRRVDSGVDFPEIEEPKSV